MSKPTYEELEQERNELAAKVERMQRDCNHNRFEKDKARDQRNKVTKELEAVKRKNEELAAQVEQLHECATVAIRWIDAVPEDMQLPAMPGFDRDWFDATLSETPLAALSALKAQWQAEAVKSLVDDCEHWSVMGEWAILVSDIAEKLERLYNRAQESDNE